MLNSGNILWVNSTNLKVNGAAITKGECRSAEGKEFNFTEPLMNKILSHFNEAVPLKIEHGDTPEVGRAYKLGFDPSSKNIPFEGHVYGDDKRRVIESYGYNKISPEIDFTFDAEGNPIDGVITALAFVKVPAMDGTEVNCQKMTFSAPSTDRGSEDMKQEGIMVFYPKGATVSIPSESTVSDNLIMTTTTGTATSTAIGMTSSSGTVTPLVSPSLMPANFEADLEKYKKMSANFEAEVVALKDTTAALETNVTDLNAQLNDYKTKVTSLEAENNSFIQEKADAVVAELKTMGFKSPETIAAELPVKQRIEVLKQMKSNFVINAPAETPTNPVEVPKGELSVREKAIAAIPEELRKYINSGV
jgi:uncharacterized protein (UPF0335 family)